MSVNFLTRNYLFSDKDPLNNNNLYRLKVIDKDETFAYSKIRQINFKDILNIAVYSNPVTDRYLSLSNDHRLGQNITI
jgi:hypothetical protein